MSATGGHSTNPNAGNRRRLVKVSVPARLPQRVLSTALDEAICVALAALILNPLSLPVLFEVEVTKEWDWVKWEFVDVKRVLYRPFPLYVALFGIRMCYFVPQWAVFGRSLPNWLFGMRVANSRTEGKLSLPRSIWRVAITHLILTPYFFGGAIIILSLLFPQAKGLTWLGEGQGVHDKLAGSVVLGQQTVSQRQDLDGSIWDLVKH